MENYKALIMFWGQQLFSEHLIETYEKPHYFYEHSDLKRLLLWKERYERYLERRNLARY